jgi:inhibitor of KinA
LSDHYTIFPLGDCAATIELGKGMSEDLNKKVLSMQKWFEKNNCAGIKDTIIAYSSLTLVYDPVIIKKHNLFIGSAYQWIQKKTAQAYVESQIENNQTKSTIRIPVCYDEEFGTDLTEISISTKLSLEEIIERHVSRRYRVYMLGFLPGFAYLGEIDPLLTMPRKQSPVEVMAGSVGIVSNQTGIYPLNSPGGWQIIGRTPVQLFERDERVPVKLKPGDEVQFYQIRRDEFDNEDLKKN